MVFCGQCGLQLPPGVARCSRCGAVANTPPDANVDTFSADAPTIASLIYAQRTQASPHPDVPHPSTPFTPPEQQKLVLRSGGGYDYALTGENEPTSTLNAPDYRTRQSTPVNFQTGTPDAKYPDNASYPAQASTVYQNRGYAAPDNNAHAQSAPSGGAIPPGYPLTLPKKQTKRRATPLLVALLGLLLVAGAATFLVVERSRIFGNAGSPGNGSITQPAPLLPTDQAKGVVQQYYDDINNQRYREAYSLWKWGATGPSFATFERGYANTEHDALTIRNATQLSNGTVTVTLTIVATERINSAIQYHTYAGYYTIGQVGGTWKILRGVLTRIK